MQLTIDEAAARLGKSARQIRYLIQNDGLPAKKIAGRWLIEADDLPLSEPQREAVGRQERALRGAVERGLGLDEERPRRYSVRDLKAFQLAQPLHQRSVDLLGPEHAATRALRRSLLLLAQGCHRFKHEDKAMSYRAGRDAASRAVCELVLSNQGEAEPIIHAIEQDLMAAFSGLLRRLERRSHQTYP